MSIRQVRAKGRVPVKIFTDEIESQAYAQLARIAELPIIHSHEVS